jgi:transcriptional regulator with XRE-family HTH domain
MRRRVLQRNRSGAKWLGGILRRQRLDVLNRTIREVAQAAGIESYNLVSYIELGSASIVPERVDALAGAYRFDRDAFRLCWTMARCFDEGTPADLLDRLFDRDDVWDRGDAPDHGRGLGHGDAGGRRAGEAPVAGTGGALCRDARGFLEAVRGWTCPPDAYDEPALAAAEAERDRVAADDAAPAGGVGKWATILSASLALVPIMRRHEASKLRARPAIA